LLIPQKVKQLQKNTQRKQVKKCLKNNKMAKKLTANQLRIAKMAPPFNKITGADFAKLKKKKKK